jgi:hypothetical protein
MVGNGTGVKLAQFPNGASGAEPCGVKKIRRDPATLKRELAELKRLLLNEELGELKLIGIHYGTE